MASGLGKVHSDEREQKDISPHGQEVLHIVNTPVLLLLPSLWNQTRPPLSWPPSLPLLPRVNAFPSVSLSYLHSQYSPHDVWVDWHDFCQWEYAPGLASGTALVRSFEPHPQTERVHECTLRAEGGRIFVTSRPAGLRARATTLRSQPSLQTLSPLPSPLPPPRPRFQAYTHFLSDSSIEQSCSSPVYLPSPWVRSKCWDKKFMINSDASDSFREMGVGGVLDLTFGITPHAPTPRRE
ncbi:hypothetical protein CVT26_007400 [Gymnopilus dilepis]|uniref:Uncharacterized protein n=1 Tax=Gymnopilus dilepis TaxID=231916 RepID=A0A409WTD4_9AGAR|nr:hypothetical protein CVT26_007400 [Gymnopilus dilepis]